MSDRFQGAAREMGGRAQQTIGEAIGDAKTQASGVYNEAVGQAQQQAARLSDVIKGQPLAAALLAIGIGYQLGRLTS